MSAESIRCGLTLLFVVSVSLKAQHAASGEAVDIATAVRNGDRSALQSLLRQHPNVNVPQADGTTPLMWAVHRNDLDTASDLIEAGADPNRLNEYGMNALSLACINRSSAMVEKLLQAGADPNSTQPTGSTALMACARTGTAEAVTRLIGRGANSNARENRRGQTALMWAVAAKHPDVVKILIERGADPDARSTNDFTPLLFAAQQGDLDSARILLSAGANINHATPEGMNPLLIASASGYEELAKFLLTQGANPNAANRDGITALHYSMLQGLSVLEGVRFDPAISHLFRPPMVELIRALLDAGADANARLRKRPVGTTPFLLAAATYDVEVMRILLNGGANPLLATKTNLTPLMAAAGLGRREDRTIEEEKASIEAVKFVVEQGADVNAANDNGQTALHAAAYTGSDAIIEFLVAKGADLNVKDKQGQTPLSIAENIIPPSLLDYGLRPFIVHKSTAELLRRLGATPHP